MKSFEFDPARNLIIPKDDNRKETEGIEENPNIAPTDAEDGKQQDKMKEREDDEFEIEQKSYETPIERAEIDKFVEDLNSKLEEKAIAIGITNKEGLELFRQQAFWLAKLDMKNMYGQAFAEELEDMKLNQGDLDFLSVTILDAVDDIHRNRKGELVGEHFSLTQKALEFVGKHKRVFNLGALTLYLSTFGSSALKAMSGDQAKIILDYDEVEKEGYEINGVHIPIAGDNDTHTQDHPVTTVQENYSKESRSAEALEAFEGFEERSMEDSCSESSIGRITTAELLENPELITLVDAYQDQNSPMSILEQISPAGEFRYEDVHCTFIVKDNTVYLKNLHADDDSVSRLHQTLYDNFDIVLNELGTQGLPLETFLDNEEDLIKAFSEELDVPVEELMTYADHVVLQDTSKVEIVKFEDFDVPVDKDNPEMIRLKEMKENIYAKHGLDTFGQIVVDEELSKQANNINTNEDGIVDYTTQESRESFLQHIQEERLNAADTEIKIQLEASGDSTVVCDSYDTILRMASRDSDTAHLKDKIANLGICEIRASDYQNSEEFQEMLLKALNEDGHPLPDLEKIAKEDPKKVVEIVSQTVGNHMNYSHLESGQIERGTAYTNLDVLHERLRHRSMPAASLGTGAGVCHDYAATVAAGLNVLEKLGVSNMDNMAVMTTTLAGVHKYVLLATYEGDTMRISLVDPTLADSGGSFDAVDEHHSYHGVSPEVYKQQKERLEEQMAKEVAAEKIETENNLAQIMAAHDEVQQRIELNNYFAFQQRIVDLMTKYYPKETRGRKIQVEKDSYRAIRGHKKKIMEVRQKISETDIDNN
ncbi:MAG: hypothetical protein PHX61_07780 [Alphaproteobacteria bacterium]|nr:hypothetical protein [Alphaproteobacteria bacterium]